MCGRVTLTLSGQEIAEIYKVIEEIEWTPKYNIAPTQQIPVIINDGKNHLKLFQWGLIPFWAKDRSIGNKMINARSETVDTKPSFRHSFQNKRCLILADGFYEWRREGRSKTPYRITIPGRKVFGFAGIWDSWRGPEGQTIDTCSIITTAANELMSTLHDRMPVILEQNKEQTWLNPSITDPLQLKPLLTPYPSGMMNAYQVSSLVNSPKNDSEECIQQIKDQGSLF